MSNDTTSIWIPIEGEPKKKRSCDSNTRFSKKRADHRNAILKDKAIRLEPSIQPPIPHDYISPFDKDKCVYCLSSKIGPTGDEFRPSTQRGRQNKINCLPCCGRCNSSKQDICGSKLITWIQKISPTSQAEKIIAWYNKYEKYLLIPLDTFDSKAGKLYSQIVMELDEELNLFYEKFS